ncbi:helix-turn-helix domain-containing protein [Oerskovia sp. M15]
MPRQHVNGGFDGTTGRSNHGGRRTHVIQLLRDSKTPVSVKDVAEEVGVHQNTARFHLESLVDAGLAERTQQTRTTPGRPKVLYRGTLPNQTHERAQAYRLLAEALTSAVADNVPDAGAVTYAVGRTWAVTSPSRPSPTRSSTSTRSRPGSCPSSTRSGSPPRSAASRRRRSRRRAARAWTRSSSTTARSSRRPAAPAGRVLAARGFINGALAELASSGARRLWSPVRRAPLRRPPRDRGREAPRRGRADPDPRGGPG